MKKITTLSCSLALLVFACGCVTTVPFTVKHDKLKNPPATRTGTLAVTTLKDTRSLTNAMQIGGKWDKAKPVYVAKQGQPVAQIVTDGLREALVHVGYQVQPAATPNLAVLEGEMSEFWLTDNWSGAFCKISLQLRLRKGSGGPVLWEKALKSEENDWAIIPNAMTAAMNTLLKTAMTEFSSQPFADAVPGR